LDVVKCINRPEVEFCAAISRVVEPQDWCAPLYPLWSGGMKLSVVTTIYRSADCVEEFHRRAVQAADIIGAELETIFVNDGSPDDGVQIAEALGRRDSRVVVVDLARNFGQHHALLAGMGVATGELIAILDGDLDEDPLWLVDFHRTMTERKCDVVFGVFDDLERSAFYRFGRNAFYLALKMLSAVSFPRNVATARLMTRRYVEAALMFEEREIFLAGVLYVAGFEQIGIPIAKAIRSPTTYTLQRLARLFIINITSFSVRPLLAISALGLILSMFAGLYITYLVIRVLVFGIQVPGWASVMGAVVLFSGVILFCNGLIAIYIGTIFLEVKRRPRFIIRSIIRNDQSVTDGS
jgi:putative glycosyltransferase